MSFFSTGKLQSALQRRVALAKASKKVFQARKDTSASVKSNTLDLGGLGKLIQFPYCSASKSE